MERIAKKTPAPCYGLEFDLSDKRCQGCAVQTGCFEALGRRRTVVPVNKAQFKLVPAKFNIDAENLVDPETPHVERTYMLCYQTIFEKRPKDTVGKHKEKMLKNVKSAGCSMRLYMLTLMIAWREKQKDILGASDLSTGIFTSKQLVQPSAFSRLDQYREMCRKEFGTFDLSSLSTLVDEEYNESDMERRIYLSELVAAKQYVALKIVKGGPVWDQLYANCELQLDPYWLAIEESYDEHVLKKHKESRFGTKTEARHRYSVAQVHSQLKKSKQFAIGVFQAREAAIRKAIPSVLFTFGYSPEDFEVVNEPFTNAMEFWVMLARAIQHDQCLKMLAGEKNRFVRS